jgi:hypothetical protein
VPASCSWAGARKPTKDGGLSQANLRSLQRPAIACIASSSQQLIR